MADKIIYSVEVDADGAVKSITKFDNEVKKATKSVKDNNAQVKDGFGTKGAAAIKEMTGGISGMSKQFKALKVAIASTGILYFIQLAVQMAQAVQELADKFGWFESDADRATRAVERHTAALEKKQKLHSFEMSQLDEVAKRARLTAEAQAKSSEERVEIENKLINDRLTAELDYYRQVIDADTKLMGQRGLSQEQFEEISKRRIESMRQVMLIEDRQKTQVLQHEIDKNKAREKAEQDAVTKAQQAASKREQIEADLARKTAAIQSARIDMIEDDYTREFEALKVVVAQRYEILKSDKGAVIELEAWALRKVEELKKKYQDKKDAEQDEKDAEYLKEQEDIEAVRIALIRDAQERELEEVSRKYDELFEKAHGSAELEKQLILAQQEEINEIRERFAKEDKERRDREVRETWQTEQAKKQAKIQLASEAAGAISALAESFAQGEGQRAKNAFKIAKAAAVAQTALDTTKAIQAVFANSAANPATILFPGYPYVMAGVAATAGLARLNQIKQVQFGAGASAGSSVGGAFGGMSAPSGQGPQPNVQLDTSFLKHSQAYVITGNVTDQQQLTNQINNQARL